MIIVFWGCGVILVDGMPRGETVIFDAHISALKEPGKRFM
jgi:hypothetical protein